MRLRPKLVLYSGGQEPSNRLLHRALEELTQSSSHKTFTYIPFCGEGSNIYFKRAVKRYQKFGFQNFIHLPVDEPIPFQKRRKAIGGDVIYLAGGNTFYFLHHLRKSGMLSDLRKFANRGGIIAGLSAGAHILTPNIYLAGYPRFNSDKNEVGLKNLNSLGLVDFEFFPHFNNSKRTREALSRYSARSKRPILAFDDGTGMIIHGNKKTLLGKTTVFFQGRSTRL